MSNEEHSKRMLKAIESFALKLNELLQQSIKYSKLDDRMMAVAALSDAQKWLKKIKKQNRKLIVWANRNNHPDLFSLGRGIAGNIIEINNNLKHPEKCKKFVGTIIYLVSNFGEKEDEKRQFDFSWQSAPNRKELTFQVQEHKKDILLEIFFSNMRDYKQFYQNYHAYLQKHHLQDLQERPRVLHNNLLEFVSAIATLFLKQELPEILSERNKRLYTQLRKVAGRKVQWSRFVTQQLSSFLENNRRFEIVLGKMESNIRGFVLPGKGSAFPSSTGKTFGPIFINAQLCLKYYLDYKKKSKFKVQDIIKILAHETMHLLDLKLVPFDLDSKELELSKKYPIKLLNRIREEGLAEVIKYRNAQEISFDGGYFSDLFDMIKVMDELLRMSGYDSGFHEGVMENYFNKIRNDRALYDVGLFYCLIYLIYDTNSYLQYPNLEWSKKEEKKDWRLFAEKAYFKVKRRKYPFKGVHVRNLWLGELLKEKIRKVKIVNIPPKIYGSFKKLEVASQEKFVKMVTEAAEALGVRGDQNVLKYFLKFF